MMMHCRGRARRIARLQGRDDGAMVGDAPRDRAPAPHCLAAKVEGASVRLQRLLERLPEDAA